MSKKDMSRDPRDPRNLTEVRVESSKRVKPSPRGTSEFVFVNNAYVGSVSSVNNLGAENRGPAVSAVPITGVYREQYWACSRWPYTQRALAVTVGVLLGALIGLGVSFIIRGQDDTSVIGPIFTKHSVPD